MEYVKTWAKFGVRGMWPPKLRPAGPQKMEKREVEDQNSHIFCQHWRETVLISRSRILNCPKQDHTSSYLFALITRESLNASMASCW